MITANSWQQRERIALISKADFDLAWALADFPERFRYQNTMNGHQTKGLVARMLVLGTSMKRICLHCSLNERERKQLLEYASNVYSQLFPRVGDMFIDEADGFPVRRIRLLSAQ